MREEGEDAGWAGSLPGGRGPSYLFLLGLAQPSTKAELVSPPGLDEDPGATSPL